MSTTVDNRVVQMRFDNEEFEKKAHKSISTLDKLKNALKFSGASKNLDDVNKSFKEVDANPLLKAIEGVNGGLTTMVAKATIVNRATNALIDTTKRFVSSMTLDQVNAGWDKYAEKTSAVQTIMAATSKDFKDTGTQMSYVNNQLEKLNWFTDETSYNFTDMVGNIGKFTSNGIKLDKSVTAMQGIALWAARSGANANEASRAMYNLSQALSTGAVKLIDWKSIENANMATAEFKENALETAAALGKLKKTGDGVYQTMKGNAVSVTNFNNALSDSWLTSDVLMQVLDKYGSFTNKLYEVSEATDLTATQLLAAVDKYADGALDLQAYSTETGVDIETLRGYLDELSSSTYALGRKSFQAGQEAKTFAEAISATSDAVSTGWMKTFEIIFGDYEEAKKLWTGLANILYDVFAASGEVRNSLLKQWANLGGRNDLLTAFQNIWEYVTTVTSLIKTAFTNIFPEKTAEDLVYLTWRFSEFTKTFQLSEEASSNISKIFSGFFSILRIGKNIFTGLVSGVQSFIKAASPAVSILGKISGNIGESIKSISDYIDENRTFEKIFSVIGNTLGAIVAACAGLLSPIEALVPPIDMLASSLDTATNTASVFFSYIGKFANTVLTIFTNVATRLKSVLNFDNVFKGLNLGVLIAILTKLMQFSPKNLGIISNIKEIFGGISDSISVFQESIKADSLRKVAISIGILAAALLIIGSIDSDKLVGSLIAVGVLFGELIMSINAFGDAFDSKKLGKVSRVSIIMIALSASIFILAGAVSKVAVLDWPGIVKGLGSVAALLFMLSKAMTSFVGDKKTRFIKGASGLIALAAAIKILASATESFAKLNLGELAKGLISVGIALAELSVFTKAFNNKSFGIRNSVALIALASALMIMSSAVSTFGNLDVATLAKGLISLALVLTEIAIAVNNMPKNMIAIGSGLLLASSGLAIIAVAFRAMGSMSLGDIGKGLLALAGSMTIIAVALKAMNGSLLGAAALVVVSAALTAFALSLKILGSMSLGEVGTAILAIAGTIVVLAGAAALLTPVIPSMILLAGTIALIGTAVLGIGVGISALAAGISMIASAGSSGIKSVADLIATVAQLIPTILSALADGIVQMAIIIGDRAPEFAAAGLKLITSLLSSLSDALPDIVATGLDLIISLLTAIRDRIGEFVQLGVDIILNFLYGINSKLTDITFAAADTVIAFVESVGEALRVKGPELITAFVDLGKDLILGLIEGMKSFVVGVKDSIIEIGTTALQTLRDVFRSHSPSEETKDIGKDYDEGLGEGINKNGSVPVDAAKKVGKDVLKVSDDTLRKRKDLESQANKDSISEESKYSKEFEKILEERYAALEEKKKVESPEIDLSEITTKNDLSNSLTGSLKASGTKAADTFLTAFETKLSDLDLDLSTIDLEQELWEATIGQTASETDKNAKETEVIKKKIEIQNEKVDQANQKYEYIVKKMGKTSEDAKKAYQELLQEQIDLANLMNQVNETQNSVADNSVDAMVAYAQYIGESKDDLLKLGFTMEQISAAAAERTGYNLQNTTQNMTDSVTSAVQTAMNTVSSTYAATAENTIGALTTNFESYGVKYAESLGNGMATTTSAVTTGAKALTNAGTTAISGDYQQWCNLGAMCAEGFKQGILSKAQEIVDAAKAIADAAFAAVQVSIDAHSPSRKFMWLGEMGGEGFAVGFENMTDRVASSSEEMSQGAIDAARETIKQIAEVIDTDPTLHPQITPVVDLTNAKAGLNKLNAMKTPVITTYVTGARVSAVASSLNQQRSNINQPVPQNNQNGPQVVEFVQNNYSPKALSRSEIYRNTNNQFTAFKEAISRV